jgi:hypothetical protein
MWELIKESQPRQDQSNDEARSFFSLFVAPELAGRRSGFCPFFLRYGLYLGGFYSLCARPALTERDIYSSQNTGRSTTLTHQPSDETACNLERIVTVESVGAAANMR